MSRSFALILQGRKEMVLGADSFSMHAGDCLLISHDLPVTARVTKTPYLALLFDVELDTLRDLSAAIAAPLPAAAEARSLAVRRRHRFSIERVCSCSRPAACCALVRGR